MVVEPTTSQGSPASHRFWPGDQVRVLPICPPGHRRTPAYVRGAIGTVERVCGPFRNPEERAYGFSGDPRRWLYRVRFPMTEVWSDYEGPHQDVVDVEIYEHWLEPAPHAEAAR